MKKMYNFMQTKCISNWSYCLVFLMFLLNVTLSNAQVTVTGDAAAGSPYADLNAAITAINTVGTLTQNTVITVASATPQTAPAGGYVITASGTAAFSLTITGNSNTVTASGAQIVGSLNDGIFKIIGGDYITIQGFTMQENAGNTVTAAATNTMTEWGVALLYATATDGAQNNTIQNNTIDLDRTYQNTFGIYSNSTHTAAAPATAASATGITGGNSGLKIYGNTIRDVNQGIVVVGPLVAADYNTGVDIGGTSVLTANTISNYGTTGTFSTYANVSGTVYGILIRNSTGYNISYNNITSSVGGVIAGTLRGIFNPSATIAPTGTFTNNINNNTIALTYGVATGTMQGITVEGTNATATSTGNINNNNFTSLTASIATSATITAISAIAPHLNVSISSNTFTNLTTNTTGSFTFIAHGYTVPITGTQTIDNNSIVTAFNKTGAGGIVTGMISGSSTIAATSVLHTNNNFSNITVTGANAITGISSSDGLATIAFSRTVTGNTFSNWTGGTGAIIGMSYTYWGGTASTLSNNTISNITGQGAITAISIGASGNTANPLAITNNTITNLTSTGTGGLVQGILCSNTSPIVNINNNTISTLSSTSATSNLNGIQITGATLTNVFKNTIYDLSNSGATTTQAVNGILLSNSLPAVNIHNNRIGNLRVPNANNSNALNGINVNTSGATNAIKVYFNTVNLDGNSSSTLFGSSAISVSSTPIVTLRNNIFVNNSTTAGLGLAVAYRRSTATLTSYDAASNNNEFLASTIYTDGTTPLATIGLFKTLVGPARDANSISVIPTFLSTVGGNANFLKLNPAVPSQLESGAANIAGITDDFEDTIRQGNPGYLAQVNGGGTAPDMGADEYDGVPAVTCSGTPAVSTISGSASVCSGLGTTLTLSIPYGDLGITYQWKSSLTPGGPYTNLGASASQATGALTATTYYVCDITCTNSSLTRTTAEKSVVVNGLPPVTLTPSTGSICSPGGTAVSLTASGGVSYTWSPTSGLTPTTGSIVSANPGGTTTYTVTGTDGNGCINTATTVITVASSISASASATPPSICSGANSQLNVAVAALAGVIKITEVTLFRTGTGATSPYPAFVVGADLVEVTNISSSPIDISGWTLGDYANNAATTSHPLLTFPIGTIIPANSVVIVCLGNGTDDISNRYFNTGGTNETWSSNALMGVVLKNGATIIDAVGLNSGYVFNPGTGVTAADWSGFAPSPSSIAGTIRTVASDTNSGSDWTQSSALLPQTVGTYNVGFTNPVSIASYAWSPATFIAGQQTIQNPLATAVTGTTTYTVTVTTTNGCVATANTTVTINPLVGLAATASSTRCAGNNFIVTSNITGGGAPYSYAWSDGSATVYPNAAEITANKPQGTYTFTCTITDNCGGASVTSAVTVTVNAIPTVVIASTPANAVICGTGTVSMTATAGLTTYAWSPATGLDATNVNTVSATPTGTTIYTVTGTDSNGCVNTATSTVGVFPSVSVTASASPSTICNGSTATLTATANSSSLSAVYAVSPLTGQTYTTLSGGGITVINTIAQLSASMSNNQDDGAALITLPFTFNYLGNPFTEMTMCTNGWVGAGNQLAVTAVNGRSAANLFSVTAPNNLIAAWFKDMGANFPLGAGSMRHGLIGTDVYAFQWDKANGSGFSDSATNLISFQINIYGPASSSPGKIEIVYGPSVGTITFATSIGIENATGGANNFINALTGNSTTTTTSTVWPSDGNGYSFSKVVPTLSWSPSTGLLPNATSAIVTTPALSTNTTYTVTITGSGGCTATSDVSVTVNSAATPTGNATQTISVTDVNSATIANLVVSPTTGIVWYASLADAQAGTNPLPTTTVLTTGATYWAVNVVSGCNSVPFAVTVTVALGNEGFDNANFSFYPNPTSSIVNITYTSAITKVTVMNLLGQILQENRTNDLQVTLDLSSYPSSTYLIRVEADAQSKIIKVVKKN